MRGRLPVVALVLTLGAVGAAGCTRGSGSDPAPARAAQPPPPPAAPAGGMPGMGGMVHGNHIPKFGGTVLMNGDLHFEVVLHRDGTYHVYFSDAARNELPASMAANVTITVTRKDRAPETVALRIDDTGESWVGQGTPVQDPDAMARIAYAVQGQPYWIDLPFSVQDPSASAKN